MQRSKVQVFKNKSFTLFLFFPKASMILSIDSEECYKDLSVLTTAILLSCLNTIYVNAFKARSQASHL